MIEIEYKEIKYQFKDIETVDLLVAQNMMPTGYIFLNDENEPRAPNTPEEKEKAAEGQSMLYLLIISRLSVSPKITYDQLNKDPTLFAKVLARIGPQLKEHFL
jgi:hypothetical protein